MTRHCSALARDVFGGCGSAAIGVVGVAELGQALAAWALVVDFCQVARCVVAVAALGSVGPGDAGQPPCRIVGELAGALGAGEGLQPPARIPAGTDGLGRF